jgi:flagellar basal-body M-ring protein/flagellar hook-basal body protein fliF/flagellar motor switch protein FliG
MEDRIQQMREKGLQVYDNLSPGRRLTLLALTIIIVGALVGLVYVSSQTEFATLYSGVDERFGGQVVQELKNRKIEYQTGPGGVIMVPANQVAELRMSLVHDGVIPGGGIGYELVDKSDMFGVPDEIIQLNKHRILEGELSRSISSITGVRQARVHLAIPKPSLFVEDKKPPSASVVIDLAGGASLSKQMVRSIVELVSGAVSGLEAERVNVVDNTGRVLNRYAEDLIGGQTSIEYQQTLEKALRDKATGVIERIVGPGNVEVVVTSKMDFSREERTEELFNPEKQVARSEETLSEERETGGNRVGGGAGDGTAQGVVRVGDASNSTRERVATNYEIDKVTKHVKGPNAELTRMSVAIVINSNYRQKREDGEELPPISDDEIENFRRLAADAVGFNKERGDSLTITAQPFQETNINMLDVLEKENTKRLWESAGQWGLMLLITAFVFFIAYRLMSYLTEGHDPAELLQDGQLPPGEDRLALPGAELLDELDEDEGPLIDKIREYVKRNPNKAAAVIRFWLSPNDEDQISEVDATKAANVLLTLGEEIASDLFARLGKEEIYALNRGMQKLSTIQENRQSEVLLEFYELCKTSNPFLLGGSNDFIKTLVERSMGEEDSRQLLSDLGSDKYNELQQINSVDSRTLANSIRKEHPQTIALILAHIDTNKGAKVLAQLPVDTQVEVCMRMASLDTVSPQTLRDVEEALMSEMKGLIVSGGEETSGVALVAEILNNIEKVHEDRIFDRLTEMDPELAEDIRNKMFTFDDLIHIDDRGTQTLLKEIDKQVLVLALKTASEEVKQKFFSNISQRAAEMIREDIEVQGAVRLSDVEAAQATIVQTALQLEADGKIVIATPGSDDQFV